VLLAGGRIGRPPTIWEIQLTRIAGALGDENLAGDGAARHCDASRPPCRPPAAVAFMDVKTPQERADEKRRQKLADMQDQIDRGELSIRQMTPDERKKNPPKPRQPKRVR
jgi:hypothetical protein